MTLLERGPQGRVPGSNPSENKFPVVNSSIAQSEACLYGGRLSGLELVWDSSKENTQASIDSHPFKRIFKPGIPRVVKNMYHRGNFEGFTTAVTIDALSTVYFLLSIPAFTAVINTAASLTDFQLALSAALAVGGVVGYESLRKDSEALDNKHFGTNSFSTTAYGITGRPLLSAEFGHVLGYSVVIAGNPIGIISILTGDTSLLTKDFAAASIAAPAWYYFFNSAIVSGKFDGIINPMREKRHAVSDNIKHRIQGE